MAAMAMTGAVLLALLAASTFSLASAASHATTNVFALDALVNRISTLLSAGMYMCRFHDFFASSSSRALTRHSEAAPLSPLVDLWVRRVLGRVLARAFRGRFGGGAEKGDRAGAASGDPSVPGHVGDANAGGHVHERREPRREAAPPDAGEAL